MFKKKMNHTADKGSVHVKFDNSNPDNATLNGEPLRNSERLRAAKSYDVDAVVNQLLREHNNPKA